MKQQCYNPYLPSWEYIPDAEPRLFDGRLYIFGSHDRFGSKDYCVNDYVAWSAYQMMLYRVGQCNHFAGLLTVLLGRVEKKLDYFR